VKGKKNRPVIINNGNNDDYAENLERNFVFALAA
jgi:hypothetical protein